MESEESGSETTGRRRGGGGGLSVMRGEQRRLCVLKSTCPPDKKITSRAELFVFILISIDAQTPDTLIFDSDSFLAMSLRGGPSSKFDCCWEMLESHFSSFF